MKNVFFIGLVGCLFVAQASAQQEDLIKAAQQAGIGAGLFGSGKLMTWYAKTSIKAAVGQAERSCHAFAGKFASLEELLRQASRSPELGKQLDRELMKAGRAGWNRFQWIVPGKMATWGGAGYALWHSIQMVVAAYNEKKK